MDVLTPDQRKLNMSRIRGKDTKPELDLRRGLHALGYRYRLQDRSLPGRPDLVLTKHKVAIFVNGCFWHGHDCPMFKAPKTNSDFWARKIAQNRVRDAAMIAALRSLGWRVLTVWECAQKGPRRVPQPELIRRCSDFILGETQEAEIRGGSAELDSPVAASASSSR
ncbi:very short patch repair endonuclease [Lysobacter soli]|uniref:very short patch repair endonuclease n=1 Tax=Lysobacter soli TaxID=453783 RepID=UPI003CEF16F9